MGATHVAEAIGLKYVDVGLAFSALHISSARVKAFAEDESSANVPRSPQLRCEES